MFLLPRMLFLYFPFIFVCFFFSSVREISTSTRWRSMLPVCFLHFSRLSYACRPYKYAKENANRGKRSKEEMLSEISAAPLATPISVIRDGRQLRNYLKTFPRPQKLTGVKILKRKKKIKEMMNQFFNIFLLKLIQRN